MADVTKEDVIEFIASMSVLELSELVKEMEEKFGVPEKLRWKKRPNLTLF